MDIYEQIKASAQAMTPQLIAWRRDFHRHPEPAWQEIRTCAKIAACLTDWGYTVLAGADALEAAARMGLPSQAVLDAAYARAQAQGANKDWADMFKDGYTAVIGILRCAEGPTLALRFDIDGLRLEETDSESHFPNREHFRSVNPGLMHACGHDAHITFGLGTAKLLSQLRHQLHGTVKLIFQPAEEGVQGARAIVEKGHLDDVDFLLGSHVTQADEENSDVTPGSTGYLASTKYDVTFRGTAAHAGASPETGSNTLLAAATAILNLHGLSRHSAGATRVNVGVVHAGTSRNVIADEAKLEMEVRGETTAINEYLDSRALTVLEAAAAMHNCTVEATVVGASEAFTCDDAVMDRVYRVCGEQMDMNISQNRTQHGGGSEDFSLMLNRVQKTGGCGTFLRIRGPMTAPLHHRDFDIDEGILPRGTAIFTAMAADILT